jgi:hypothetical protein
MIAASSLAGVGCHPEKGLSRASERSSAQRHTVIRRGVAHMASSTEFTQSFDRYELVAITLPGAALVLVVTYLYHERLSSGLNCISKVDVASLETLGVFVVASFVLGHIVQAVAHYLERLFERHSWERRLQASSSKRARFDAYGEVPPNLRLDVATALCALYPALRSERDLAKPLTDFTEAGATLIRNLRPQLLARVRATRAAPFFETLKVNAGVNRGLFGVSAITFIIACAAGDVALIAATSLLMPLFFRRYRDYEHERNTQLWIALVDAGKS